MAVTTTVSPLSLLRAVSLTVTFGMDADPTPGTEVTGGSY